MTAAAPRAPQGCRPLTDRVWSVERLSPDRTRVEALAAEGVAGGKPLPALEAFQQELQVSGGRGEGPRERERAAAGEAKAASWGVRLSSAALCRLWRVCRTPQSVLSGGMGEAELRRTVGPGARGCGWPLPAAGLTDWPYQPCAARLHRSTAMLLLCPHASNLDALNSSIRQQPSLPAFLTLQVSNLAVAVAPEGLKATAELGPQASATAAAAPAS